MKKVLLVLVMMIVGCFLIPVTYAASFGADVASFLGVDITQSLMAGGSAAVTSIASLLVLFRKAKTQVSNLDVSTKAFLNGLEEKLTMVLNGEMSIEDFKKDLTVKIGDLTQDFKNLINDYKGETNAIRAELTTVREQYLVMKTVFEEIKASELNIETMIKIGFGNMKEMVENGYAKQIYQVGEVKEVTTDESQL